MPEPFNYIFAPIFILFILGIICAIIFIPFIGFEKVKRKLKIKEDSIADNIFMYLYLIAVLGLTILIFDTGFLASFF
jgi:hypothetical protein